MSWFLLATISALLSAGAAVLQKKSLMTTGALPFAFVLSFLVMLLSAVFLAGIDVIAVPPDVLLLLVGKSILGGTAFLLVMMSLERGQISNVLPLLGLTPAVTALLSLMLTGEVMREAEWLGLGLMMGGLYLLEWAPGPKGGMIGRMRTVIAERRAILLALLLFAVSSVADKLLVSTHRTDPRVVLVYQHVVFCLLFGVMLLARRVPGTLVLAQAKKQLPLFFLIAVLTIAYRFTQLEATKDAPVALVLAVKRTSILYASVLGGKIFVDDRLPMRLAGAALIVAAGFIILRNVG
jgi:drug/metabolite transporter (DMT)-like permease